MIKVVPYIETSKTKEFKLFLDKPFTIDMLYPIFNEKSCDTIFDEWRGKDMISWYKFINDNNVVLEFYPQHYIIKKLGLKLPIPKTINEFINDMVRFEIQIFWMKSIDLIFEPKDYLRQDLIKNYFTDLLFEMGKSEELI